ncbi:hypothetical protein [Synechococcus sp. 1G10]|uniref:hypothetical protein n=1 Tax=Synechococcus sp. 1G10 TaxID=2025605 RepID=UPI0018E9587A|nr:hypothetical protein [Synechococcus sp. 1G10]
MRINPSGLLQLLNLANGQGARRETGDLSAALMVIDVVMFAASQCFLTPISYQDEPDGVLTRQRSLPGCPAFRLAAFAALGPGDPEFFTSERQPWVVA